MSKKISYSGSYNKVTLPSRVPVHTLVFCTFCRNFLKILYKLSISWGKNFELFSEKLSGNVEVISNNFCRNYDKILEKCVWNFNEIALKFWKKLQKL